MSATSLLALLDDITALLDDIAVMTKGAASKTAGVLGDDLAVNAEQVTGVRAERELPVVWAVAKGSLLNKAILVPMALLLSAFMPWLISPILLLGGLYLCFEGAEKILHHATAEHHQAQSKPAENLDLMQFEREKIKGAIRTDFVLSIEIIVITLGMVADAALFQQASVLSIVAIAATLGVYGLVALIVKLDDMGLHILKLGIEKQAALLKYFGRGLLKLAPLLMKTLTLVGTIAMFLVGGGIIAHVFHPLAHWAEHITQGFAALFEQPSVIQILTFTLPSFLEALAGLVAGFVLFVMVTGLAKLKALTD